jgi:hypothetical protein
MTKSLYRFTHTKGQAFIVLDLLRTARFAGKDISVLLPDGPFPRVEPKPAQRSAATLEGALSWLTGLGGIAFPRQADFLPMGR